MLDYESSRDETDKFCSYHNYRLLYQNFFLTPHRKILEIGTSSCGFAKFLKDNNIGEFLVGVDLRKDIVSGHVPSNKTWCELFDEFYVGDVSKPEFKEWAESNFRNDFDLIIEDCSHKLEQQKYLISLSQTLLSDKGVWITEDIHGYDNAKEVIKCVPDALQGLAYVWDGWDSKKRYDDFCVVIDRRRI